MRARMAVLLGSLALCRPGSAGAEDLPGGRIEVFRSPAAVRCPDGASLVRELTSRMTEEGGRERARGELFIRVRIDQESTSFVAAIEVTGRKQGVRTLKTAGPGCEALSDALLVALLVLLDEDPERAVARPDPTPAAAAPAGEAPPPAESSEQPGALDFDAWLGAGGAITYGIPDDFSFALFGELTLRFPRWEASAGVFWAPPRDVPFESGTVTVRVWGARLRGCVAVAHEPGYRLSGCGSLVLASLTGEGEGYDDGGKATIAPWWLAGVGPDFRWFFAARWALGVSGSVLFSPFRESFTIGGLVRPAYETRPVLGWLGADLAVQIW
jgi:hypothetical protein